MSVLLSAGAFRAFSAVMSSGSSITLIFIFLPSCLPVNLYICLLVSVRIHQHCVGLLTKSQSQPVLLKTLPASPLHPLPPSPWTIDSFQYEKCSWFSAIPQWLNLLPNLDCPYSRRCLCFYLPQRRCGQSRHVPSLSGVAHQAGNKTTIEEQLKISCI